jgi:hypothetical protein
MTEAFAVFGGEVLGGEHDDGDARGPFVLTEALGELEAAHPRHHQVEHDHVGP